MSYILCDLAPKLKVIGEKAGICDGVPSTAALVLLLFSLSFQKCISMQNLIKIYGAVQELWVFFKKKKKKKKTLTGQNDAWQSLVTILHTSGSTMLK